MSLETACRRQDQPLEFAEPTIVHMTISVVLWVFTELGASRVSQLLDAIADSEYVHELTMVD